MTRRTRDEDQLYEEQRQRALDAEMFGGAGNEDMTPVQPKPAMTKCPKCEHLAAQVICSLCGTERPFYTDLKARLAAGSLPPVNDHNAAQVLRTLKGDAQ